MALPICLHTVCGCFCTIMAERDILTKVYKAKNIYFLAMHCLVINNLLPGHLLLVFPIASETHSPKSAFLPVWWVESYDFYFVLIRIGVITVTLDIFHVVISHLCFLFWETLLPIPVPDFLPYWFVGILQYSGYWFVCPFVYFANILCCGLFLHFV